MKLWSDPTLERFYRGIYLDAFAAQREPLDAWHSALAGEQPYWLNVRIETAGDAILGGIAYEHYPESNCGLVTYMVVAPQARGQGLGRRLLTEAAAELHARGARAVFGEVNDPRRPGRDAEWERLLRFQRWGCRVVGARYVQPALGPDLARDRGLCLIALPPLGDALAGDVVRAFVAELHAVTERRAPDDEVRAILDGVPERVPLVVVSPGHGHADGDG